MAVSPAQVRLRGESVSIAEFSPIFAFAQPRCGAPLDRSISSSAVARTGALRSACAGWAFEPHLKQAATGLSSPDAALSAFLERGPVGNFLQRCPAIAAVVLLLVGAAIARAAPVPAPLTAQDTLELQRIAAYLNGIRTMTAGFQQIANNGGLSTGHLWVARPGRMRFEYQPPSPITLLADSTSVYYWDKQLGQTSKYDLRSTPAWFFLRDPINFGSDVIVTRFEHAGGAVRVTVVESAEPDAGSLTLAFTGNPPVLRQWTVVDQQGKTTHVTLSDLQFGMALDPRLFQYQSLFTGTNR
jgi:outer membrane lipoprotein-sorting protein